MKVLPEPIGFIWDEGNNNKNQIKHNVSNSEAEGVFFDSQKIIAKDKLHSQTEERFLLIGQTSKKRQLFVVFTIRDAQVRIISARDLNKKEKYYMKKQLKLPAFQSEDQELDFWSQLDLSEYFESQDFTKLTTPNLKPSSKSISIRIPEYLLNQIKEKANAINVPYQSLIKGYLKKGLLG